MNFSVLFIHSQANLDSFSCEEQGKNISYIYIFHPEEKYNIVVRSFANWSENIGLFHISQFTDLNNKLHSSVRAVLRHIRMDYLDILTTHS